MLKQPLLIQVQKNQTESSRDLSPVTCQATLMGLRGNYQLDCRALSRVVLHLW